MFESAQEQPCFRCRHQCSLARLCPRSNYKYLQISCWNWSLGLSPTSFSNDGFACATRSNGVNGFLGTKKDTPWRSGEASRLISRSVWPSSSSSSFANVRSSVVTLKHDVTIGDLDWHHDISWHIIPGANLRFSRNFWFRVFRWFFRDTSHVLTWWPLVISKGSTWLAGDAWWSAHGAYGAWHARHARHARPASASGLATFTHLEGSVRSRRTYAACWWYWCIVYFGMFNKKTTWDCPSIPSIWCESLPLDFFVGSLKYPKTFNMTISTRRHVGILHILDWQ